MIQYLKDFFADCFGFNPDRFEQYFFEAYNIPYTKKEYIDEHWFYYYKDIIYKVNSMECIVFLNKKERFHVEFIHNMKYNAESLFFATKCLY